MAPLTHLAHVPPAPLSMSSVGETPSITAVAGGQLILECPEDAVPPPHIEWHQEGSPVQVCVTGPEMVDGQGLGCTFPSPIGVRVMWGELLTGALGTLGGSPQADSGRGAIPADPSSGGSRWWGVQLQGHQCAGGHQPACPRGGSR